MLAPSDAQLRLIRFIADALDDLESSARWHVEHADGECAHLLHGKLIDVRRRFRAHVVEMGVLV